MKLYIDRGVNFSQLHFWDRFYLRELLYGSLRKPQKSETLEPAKVDKSATIFWTQKPEGLSHVERKIFSFSFPCLKNLEGRLGLISWFISFCCVFWGKENTLFIGITVWKVFTAFIKAKFNTTFESDSLAFKWLSLWDLQFSGSCFYRNLFYSGGSYYHHVSYINLISSDPYSVYERTCDNLANNNLLSTLIWCSF